MSNLQAKEVICPYCGNTAKFVDSSCVYRKSYGMIYLCNPCRAYVGVHKGTSTPLGRLANEELRMWKKKAHLYFDNLWKAKIMSRTQAYKWLAQEMDKPSNEAHIGMFDVGECRKVIEKVLDYKRGVAT